MPEYRPVVVYNGILFTAILVNDGSDLGIPPQRVLTSTAPIELYNDGKELIGSSRHTGQFVTRINS